MNPDLPAAHGRLVENVVHFCRALRKAGIKTGTAQLETTIQAVAASGFSNKTDFYYTLRSSLIVHQQDLEVFHQVFSMFWRDPEFLQEMMLQLSPALQDERVPLEASAARRRATEAFGETPRTQLLPKQETIKDLSLIHI